MDLKKNKSGQLEIQGEDLDQVRKACLDSTFAFARFVCQHKDLDADFHGMMSRWIEKPTRFKLGMAPRGHFKSTIWTVADSLRRVTKEPETQILIINEKEENIHKWIRLMQEVVLSPLYGALFPDRVPNLAKVRWNANQLELKRDNAMPQPCIEGNGIGSATTSNHYNVIKPDDLVSEEAYNSILVMEAAVEKRKRMDSLLVSPAQSEIHDICTRWGPNDPANWVMKNVQDVDVMKLSVWKDEDKTVPWFPGRPDKPFFPKETLDKLRVQYGAKDWALLYLNEIIGGEATKFNAGDLRYWTTEMDEEGVPSFVLERPGKEARKVKVDDCFKFQIVDAGLSPESHDARTANVVAAITPPTTTGPFDIVILEAKATRSLPNEVIKEAKFSYDRWNPMLAAIETFGGHQAFFYWIAATFPDMRIRQLDKDFSKNAKHKRIIGFWGSYLPQGRVYINRHAHLDLVDELIAYPTGKTVDLLDAAGYLPSVWAPPQMARPKRVSPSDLFDLADIDPEDMASMENDGWSPVTGY